MTLAAGPRVATPTGRSVSTRAASVCTRTAVVVITRDRRDELLHTIDRLEAAGAGDIVVVDNGSSDGTSAAVRSRHPGVTLVRSEVNLAAAGRNLGAMLTDAPYIAFCDDDSWWDPGAIERAAAHLDRHPDLAAVCAAIRLAGDDRLDPVSLEMAASPLPGAPGEPGPRLVGFVACATMVRRSAFLAAGGFHRRYGVGGEEEMLAIDLVDAGWGICFAPDVVVRHRPSAQRAPASRRRRVLRNRLWTLWARRPLSEALTGSLAALRRAGAEDPPVVVAGTAVQAVRALPWLLRERRVVAASTLDALRLVERSGGCP